ncbi:MAG TPA: replication initiator protein A [Lachnospiraceae bacterium]
MCNKLSVSSSEKRRHRIEDAATFEFYQQPKQLYKGKYQKALNNNDRTVYMLIYNRFQLSVKNKMIDKDGYVFIYFEEKSLAVEAAISDKTVKTCIKRLRSIGLIDVVQQGCNRPNRIYVLKPEYDIPEVQKLHIQDNDDEKNFPSGVKNSLLEVQDFPVEVKELPTSNTINNTTKKDKYIISNHEDTDVDEIEEHIKELVQYDLIEEKQDIEINCVLDDIIRILTFEVFMAPNDKRFNLGTAEQPDYKSAAMIKSVFEKNLQYAVVWSYIEQFLMNANPVTNGTMYHIKGLYRQCMTQSTQYLSKNGNLHRWNAPGTDE